MSMARFARSWKTQSWAKGKSAIWPEFGCTSSRTKQLALLAYTFEERTITLTLLALGQHENFYPGLKKSL
uniref:ParE-like toxin of type II toxin-antitoxin system n=1 Tax=Candidatus Kentrum sp. LPFa TaxID=2126335 RepID=A0A450X867_9GAMM|nr:MAG: ParE-like toxin of type II toxin-antitoxin system [Candidatus Kentron sp. LPFa]VFK36060.1 MAG: ParE-like toxin of type II toxin-antitoxin system [Candidatus Kentron sp. LPFa]